MYDEKIFNDFYILISIAKIAAQKYYKPSAQKGMQLLLVIKDHLKLKIKQKIGDPRLLIFH
jgi:hypothetical protein